MIIVHLCGGLGNQLFQYAFGFALAQERGVPLKLDITHFATDDLRTYALEPYGISATIANAEEIARLSALRKPRQNRILNRLFPVTQTFYEYVDLPYREQYTRVPKDAYMKGYWQSEKYFAVHRKALVNEFRLTSPLSPINQRFAEEIQRSNAVSLHIRRGDYVSSAITNWYHGTCSMEYYQRAVEIIAEKMPSPTLYVFTDDPAWAKENLHLPYPTIVLDDERGSHDYEDMHLMSLCKHHIIANSSFSWWGAWLNESTDKLVIAPKQWLANEEHNRHTLDLVPNTWMRI